MSTWEPRSEHEEELAMALADYVFGRRHQALHPEATLQGPGTMAVEYVQGGKEDDRERGLRPRHSTRRINEHGDAGDQTTYIP